MLTMKTCFRTLDNIAKPINLLYNELLNKEVSTNRSKLFSVAKNLLFCGRQNILLHGRRGDAAYMAPMIVQIFKHCFFEKFSHNKRGNNIFSILADEVSDCSFKEQMPLGF